MADPERPLAGKHCLVLDDEFLITLDIQQILERAGAAAVTCVGNAADALAALRRPPRFDLAVLDVHLTGPARSSVTVAAALTRQGVPFVFITGMPSDDEHITKFPGVPVVDKPYQVPLLMDALLRALAPR